MIADAAKRKKPKVEVTSYDWPPLLIGATEVEVPEEVFGDYRLPVE